jgi:hypothetical protein
MSVLEQQNTSGGGIAPPKVGKLRSAAPDAPVELPQRRNSQRESTALAAKLDQVLLTTITKRDVSAERAPAKKPVAPSPPPKRTITPQQMVYFGEVINEVERRPQVSPKLVTDDFKVGKCACFTR